MGVKWDDSDFKLKTAALQKKTVEASKKGLFDIGLELLRLSQKEVPHDVGTLQNSGHIEPGFLEGVDDEVIVGYNTVYAARLHENPQYHFKNGRKGKYLEDPLKTNLDVFGKFYKEAIAKVLGG